MKFGQNKRDTGNNEKENFLLPVSSIGGEIEIGDMMEDISENAQGFRTDDDDLKRFKPHKSFDHDCDLYGDLEGAVFSPAKRGLSIPEKEALELQLEQANKEIEELKERITVLSRENRNLQNNFASLLKTAKEDKEKNIFTLRELRTKLKNSAQLHAQNLQLPKEEIREILNYCNQVEHQLQSRISLDIVREALREMKTEKPKNGDPKQKWTKCIRLDDNMTFYVAKEQVPFKRLEAVQFPKTQKNPVQPTGNLGQASLQEHPPKLSAFSDLSQNVPETAKQHTQSQFDVRKGTNRNSTSSNAQSAINRKEPDRRPIIDGPRNRSKSPRRRRSRSRNRRSRSRTRSNHPRKDSTNKSRHTSRSRSRSDSRDRSNRTRSSRRRQSNR